MGYALAALSLYLAYSASDIGPCMIGLCCAAFFLYGGFGPVWSVVLDLTPGNLRRAFPGFVNCSGSAASLRRSSSVGWSARLRRSRAAFCS